MESRKIAMIVFNTCSPDARVMKEAEALVEMGHTVRVFCLYSPGLPKQEERNGVEYVRFKKSSAVLIGLYSRVKWLVKKLILKGK